MAGTTSQKERTRASREDINAPYIMWGWSSWVVTESTQLTVSVRTNVAMLSMCMAIKCHLNRHCINTPTERIISCRVTAWQATKDPLTYARIMRTHTHTQAHTSTTQCCASVRGNISKQMPTNDLALSDIPTLVPGMANNRRRF